ncbi:PilN domain-containing protein [Candidatus Saccharibacteria bacterium]|nr:PilN domain-containing protein [Candidatus Saccharibacteria bacterium]
MINLLPPDVKTQYHYAQRNVILRRWAVTLVLALGGLVVITAFGLLYMYQLSSSYDREIKAATASLQQQRLSETQKDVKDISSNLKLAVQVLSKEVLFSKLLKQMAAVTPSNVKLANLNISQEESAVDITAKARDYNAATQLQVNLSDPNNKIFSKADIVSITCATNSDGSRASGYPCTATIRALFSTENPYLFINNGGA